MAPNVWAIIAALHSVARSLLSPAGAALASASNGAVGVNQIAKSLFTVSPFTSFRNLVPLCARWSHLVWRARRKGGRQLAGVFVSARARHLIVFEFVTTHIVRCALKRSIKFQNEVAREEAQEARLLPA